MLIYIDSEGLINALKRDRDNAASRPRIPSRV